MRECGDNSRREDKHERDPAFASAVTQVAEDRIADGCREENGTQQEAGVFRIQTVGLLEKERTEAAHAAAAEIAHAEAERRRDEKHPERRCGKETLTAGV